ncbi:hypothetical protein H1R20_g15613, partial [Candolleomyces eurysporus]
MKGGPQTTGTREPAPSSGDSFDLGDIANNIEQEEKEMDEGPVESDEELDEDELEMFEKALGKKIDEVAVPSKPVRLVLTKLQKIAYAIKNSPMIILPRWKALIEEVATTRWNSTYNMVRFVWVYQQVIDQLTSQRDLDLRKFKLTDKEWELVKQLHDTLKVFKMMTLHFSSETASLTDVIPAMDQMYSELTTAAKNKELHISLRSALSLGVDLLNKYYSLTDESEVYQIAIILHPSYKLCYLKKAGWPEEWRMTAENIVRDDTTVFAFLRINTKFIEYHSQFN